MDSTTVPANSRGLFVVFEGGEGSGKTTQSKMLYETLKRHEINVMLTREPGGTPLGAALRSMLLTTSEAPKSRKAELLMFLADRAEHIETVVKPALDEGTVVICDRYEASTMAYQAHAGGLNESAVQQFSSWSANSVQADVTYWLDVDPYVGLERANRVARTRFEDMNLAFHETVRRSFQYQHDQNSRSWVKLNSNDGIDGVHRLVTTHFIGVFHALQKPLSNFLPKAKQIYFGGNHTAS